MPTMSDKRSISEVSTPISDHDDKKAHTKPGRKPLDSEPKSKRTAQNRAAQRAYRERKERKMKDLEDQVKSLEDAHVRVSTESDFLRAQVDMLKNELARYRGHSDFSDLNLPTKVGHLSNPNPKKEEEDSESPEVSKQLLSKFPWSKDNLQSFNELKRKDRSNQQVPDLIAGGSLSSTSPLNDNILVSPESQSTDSDFANNFEEQVEPFCIKLNEACGTKECPIPKYKRHDSTTTSDASQFAKKNNNHSLDVNNQDSPFASLYKNDHENDANNDPFFNNSEGFNYDFLLNTNNDPLSFLNDNAFDVSLAFADNFNQNKKEADPLANLTTEESAYDPYSDEVNTNFNFNEFVKSSLPSVDSSGPNSVRDSAKSSTSSYTSYNSNNSNKRSDYKNTPTVNETPNNDDDDDEVVPAPERTVRCSEIWDRITSHPKYTEIDIDGLCNELKSKAKCSENGVVLNSNDVNALLERSAVSRN